MNSIRVEVSDRWVCSNDAAFLEEKTKQVICRNTLNSKITAEDYKNYWSTIPGKPVKVRIVVKIEFEEKE